MDGEFGFSFGDYGLGESSDGEHTADRTAQPLPLKIGFRLLSMVGAVRVRVTVVRPDGQEISAECASSPCSVSGDRQQGEHRFKLEYIASNGAVLGASELQPVRVGS